MKRLQRKIILLFFGVFFTASLILMVAFSGLMNNYIKNGATEAIDQYYNSTLYQSWEYRFSPYFASGIQLKKTGEFTYQLDEYSDEPSLPYKGQLVSWLSKNRINPGEIVKAQISNRTYYLFLEEFKGNNQYVNAIYVDVTSETLMVSNIRIAIFFIMLICSLGASLAGVFMGKRIEQEHWQQKKNFENASHQLKTPLMVMQGYAEGIANGLLSNPKQAAEIIVDETEKMSLLIDEILNLSRIDSNEVPFSFKNISVEELLNDCLTHIEFLAQKRGIQIEADIEDQMVKGDEVQLERAIINVLSNAIRYAKTTIRVSYQNKNLVIWNDGSSVEEDELEHIFKRFYIGKSGNTGIGLSLTREVIERHGWSIRAENLDGGMRFIIQIK